MKFYLPNFEDLIDPEYDFVHDQPSPRRKSRYEHDWYAHQFFEEPIFDGVLMSKTVIRPPTERRIRAAGGVHAFIRLDQRFPIMGDCGAFSYRTDEVPPYSTDEILDYYEALGFTYGVSIDHVIFGTFPPEEQARRWNITVQNAKDFLRRHREKGYAFTPVGIAQGPTPERYAQAIRHLIDRGYDHLALGGLARATDKGIRTVLQAISPELRPGIELHLFGVARLSLIADFLRYGVTSVDSASPVRRAFMGTSEDNYWVDDTNHYAAIRVPEAKSRRRKRGLDRPEDIVNGDLPVNSLEQLVELEQQALSYLRAYDQGEVELEDTLQAVLVYDRLFGVDRDHERWYRRALTDRPWKDCDCPICREVGIEVIIFRGNNRNRRRGFHNAQVFYRLFRSKVAEVEQALTNGSAGTGVRQLSLELE